MCNRDLRNIALESSSEAIQEELAKYREGTLDICRLKINLRVAFAPGAIQDGGEFFEHFLRHLNLDQDLFLITMEFRKQCVRCGTLDSCPILRDLVSLARPSEQTLILTVDDAIARCFCSYDDMDYCGRCGSDNIPHHVQKSILNSGKYVALEMSRFFGKNERLDVRRSTFSLNDRRYHRFGVIVFLPRVEHYYAYVRLNDRWIRINDSQVQPLRGALHFIKNELVGQEQIDEM